MAGRGKATRRGSLQPAAVGGRQTRPATKRRRAGRRKRETAAASAPPETLVLHAAARAGDTAALQRLLENEERSAALLEARDASGQTPLHCAVRARCADAVCLLLEAGSHLEARMCLR